MVWEKDNDTKSDVVLNQSLNQFNYDHIIDDVPIVLNSVPKSGTNLVRNMILHFVGKEQTCPVAVTGETFEEISGYLNQKKYSFYYGHLFKDNQTYLQLRNTKLVLLMRDPVSYLPSLARWAFHPSKPWGDISEIIQNTNMPFHEVVSYSITGVGMRFRIPSVKEMFLKNLIEWMDSATILLKYEDIIRHLKKIDSQEAEIYFFNIFHKLGISIPDDWKNRILAGANPENSPTFFRGNKEKLTENHLKIIESVAPGLRNLLGYS